MLVYGFLFGGNEDEGKIYLLALGLLLDGTIIVSQIVSQKTMASGRME